MTRKQRAAPQSAPPKGQTPPATRQHRAKRDEGTAAAKRSAAQESNAQTIEVSPRATWRLEEAKARFSEVVRRAHDQGPQYVTVRGKQAVAIIDAAELERLLPASPEVVPLVQFLEGLHIEGLDLTRERDLGREHLALIGWLVDTNVIASLIAPGGAPSVKAWGALSMNAACSSAS